MPAAASSASSCRNVLAIVHSHVAPHQICVLGFKVAGSIRRSLEPPPRSVNCFASLQHQCRIVERLVTDAPPADPALRVDEKGAVQRLVVEIDTAIGLEDIQLRIRQQREGKAAFFLVSGQRILELLRRVGADGDQIDPGVGKLAGLLPRSC